MCDTHVYNFTARATHLCTPTGSLHTAVPTRCQPLASLKCLDPPLLATAVLTQSPLRCGRTHRSSPRYIHVTHYTIHCVVLHTRVELTSILIPPTTCNMYIHTHKYCMGGLWRKSYGLATSLIFSFKKSTLCGHQHLTSSPPSCCCCCFLSGDAASAGHLPRLLAAVPLSR